MIVFRLKLSYVSEDALSCKMRCVVIGRKQEGSLTLKPAYKNSNFLFKLGLNMTKVTLSFIRFTDIAICFLAVAHLLSSETVFQHSSRQISGF